MPVTGSCQLGTINCMNLLNIYQAKQQRTVKQLALTTFIWIALTLSSTDTQAVVVRGQMHGLIAESSITRGLGSSVFGLDGNALLGQAFTIDFRYDTDLAPVSSSFHGSVDARSIYSSSDALLNWLDLSITVNNKTHPIVGNNRYADVIDVFPTFPGAQGDYFQLAVEGGSGPFDGVSFRREFLDVSVSLPRDALTDIALPASSIYWNQIKRVYNSAAFSINEFDVDPSTNLLTYERVVMFNMDIQLVEASVVPIPSALWLFGSGLLGLVGISWRKRG